MRRCLIVDDSDVIRRVARRILEDLRFEVVEAQSGQEAIDICNADLPDAVLLDWHMPGMMGLEVIPKLRAPFDDRRPYIVYAVTENDSTDITRALTAGASDYILKPFDRRDLEAKFATVEVA